MHPEPSISDIDHWGWSSSDLKIPGCKLKIIPSGGQEVMTISDRECKSINKSLHNLFLIL
jgi:hypothetical protein